MEGETVTVVQLFTAERTLNGDDPDVAVGLDATLQGHDDHPKVCEADRPTARGRVLGQDWLC